MGRARTWSDMMAGLRRIRRHFAPYLRQQRGLMAGSLGALLISVVLRVLEPWPIKFVFDRVIVMKHTHKTVAIPALDELEPMTVVTIMAIALVIITSLRALADYWNTVTSALLGNRVLSDIRSELYRHLQCLSLSFHTKARGGDLLVRVIGDINMLKDVAVSAILPLLANSLILVSMLSVMCWLNWRLAALSLVVFPLFFLSTLRLTRRIHQTARDQRKREGAMAATAAESIGAMRVVQTLSLEDKFHQQFATQNTKSLREGVQGSKLAAALERRVDVLIAISTALVLWQGSRYVVHHELTPGDLYLYLIYLKRAFNPLQDFAKYTGRLAKATAAGERVADLLEQEPDIRDLPDAVPAPVFTGAITFDHISFAYEPGRHVLTDFTLAIAPGQHVAIVGESGIGKTTLASLVPRLYDPSQGRVLIDGHDIRGYTLATLRSQVSVLLQDTLLFAASVRDNIAYGAPDTVTPEQIEAAARLANAHEFVLEMPDGYDTVLGERGVTLSNGQRQRIAIARAAVRRAPILILDEPTTGLDKDNAGAVTEALERLAETCTAIMITHDLRLASRSDLILCLGDDDDIERGTHDELLQANGRYAALYKLQMAVGSTTVSAE